MDLMQVVKMEENRIFLFHQTAVFSWSHLPCSLSTSVLLYFSSGGAVSKQYAMSTREKQSSRHLCLYLRRAVGFEGVHSSVIFIHASPMEDHSTKLTIIGFHSC